MPWVLELFSAPLAKKVKEKRRRELETVPFFDGVLSGEFDALVHSFAGEPELHHPARGRVRGMRAFEAYVTQTRAWLRERNASIENVEYVGGRRGVVEVVLHLDDETGRVERPVAVVFEKQSDGLIVELRIYCSSWPLTGRHTTRSPLLQPDPELRATDLVAKYQCALAVGDLDAVVGAFEPDGSAREPTGGRYVHAGLDGLRRFRRPSQGRRNQRREGGASRRRLGIRGRWVRFRAGARCALTPNARSEGRCVGEAVRTGIPRDDWSKSWVFHGSRDRWAGIPTERFSQRRRCPSACFTWSRCAGG